MIHFDVRGIKELDAWMKSLQYGTRKAALPALGEYIIGNGRRGLKRYPVYKYVSRLVAYGKSFVSRKQQAFVMASIREGRIDPGVPHRTGRTQRAYEMKIQNNGYRVIIQNKTRGAVYTRHDQLQARLNLLAGWRKVSDVVSTNIKGAIRHAQSKVNEYLKRKARK